MAANEALHSRRGFSGLHGNESTFPDVSGRICPSPPRGQGRVFVQGVVVWIAVKRLGYGENLTVSIHFYDLLSLCGEDVVVVVVWSTWILNFPLTWPQISRGRRHTCTPD